MIDLAACAIKSALGQSVEVPDGLSILAEGVCAKPIDPTTIDLIVLTTVSPDMVVPCNAAALKKILGLENAIAFDINAACTGFIYGLTVAESMMAASQGGVGGAHGRNPIKRALVVSAERLTHVTDWQDRNTCVLFGDGAGAAVLEWKDGEAGIISTYLKNDDDESNALTCKHAYASPLPFGPDGVIYDEEAKAAHDEEFPDPKAVDYTYINSLDLSCDPATQRLDELFDLVDKPSLGGPGQTIYMNGQKVFKFAARAMEAAVLEVARRAGITVDQIKFIVPHQANLRIIEFAAKRLGFDLDRFQLSIETTGNCSSACVPMALTDALASQKVEPGDYVALVAFGGGLTSGAVLIQF